MGAPIGNDFWKLRKDMSEDGKKLSIDEIATKAQEYIDRCVNESILQHDVRGKFNEDVRIEKRITMSVWGLCHWLGIAKSTWEEWTKDEKYSDITSRVNNIMKSWNVEGAGAGELNPNIIARLEGLRDEQVHELKGEVKTNIISFGGKEVKI